MHNGVNSLIAAVLLSAIVILLLLAQTPTVSRSRVLRGLALLWVAQNIALVASVLLRLRLYVESYQLTTLRLYVSFFLLLVTVGFVLLAWRIVRNRSFWWLVLANCGATLALFATVQFLDINSWVADFNVRQWEGDPHRDLDVAYLLELGPSAYPALLHAAETPNRADAQEAYRIVSERQRIEALHRPENGRAWRSRQLRPDQRADELIAHHIATRQP